MTDKNRRCAVYRLYDTAGVLLYVGAAYYPPARYSAHSIAKPWWPEVAGRSVTWYETRKEALAAEKVAVGREHPVHNERLQAGAKTVVIGVRVTGGLAARVAEFCQEHGMTSADYLRMLIDDELARVAWTAGEQLALFGPEAMPS